MVILITGASHTGKTLLAQRMLEKYKYPSFSIDHLKMGLIRSGNTSLTPLDDDALTDYLWPIVREMIKTAIENRQNLIVEGCYVPFDWRKDFHEEYLTDIRFICLAMTGDYIDRHFGDITGKSSVIESRQDDSDCSVASLKEDNRQCCEGFLKAGEQVTLIDGSFEQVLESLLSSEFNQSFHHMKKYLIRSIITALVFIGLTLLFDAIFGEIGDFRKYLITGLLFGFIYEGWWHLYQKGVFSRRKSRK